MSEVLASTLMVLAFVAFAAGIAALAIGIYSFMCVNADGERNNKVPERLFVEVSSSWLWHPAALSDVGRRHRDRVFRAVGGFIIAMIAFVIFGMASRHLQGLPL
jgi:hypothetical protein